jgi:hypothetical protein
VGPPGIRRFEDDKRKSHSQTGGEGQHDQQRKTAMR